MRIVKVIGGLGNQMFQFALYKALQKRFPEEQVLLDLHCFNGYHKHSGFEIGRIFHAEYKTASLIDITKLAYPYPNFQSWRIGSRILPKRKTILKEKRDLSIEIDLFRNRDNTYYDGYWQHDYYFANIRGLILATFSFPAFECKRDCDIALQAINCNSVAIHVRRGDYIKDKLFKDISTIDYYRAAIKEIYSRVSPDIFYIFSNDITWCKQLEDYISSPIVYVDWHTGTDSYRDMQLMSLCKHHIIANSSFSWWGAWLHEGKGQIVICPRKWMNIDNLCSPAQESWIKI